MTALPEMIVAMQELVEIKSETFSELSAKRMVLTAAEKLYEKKEYDGTADEASEDELRRLRDEYKSLERNFKELENNRANLLAALLCIFHLLDVQLWENYVNQDPASREVRAQRRAERKRSRG